MFFSDLVDDTVVVPPSCWTHTYSRACREIAFLPIPARRGKPDVDSHLWRDALRRVPNIGSLERPWQSMVHHGSKLTYEYPCSLPSYAISLNPAFRFCRYIGEVGAQDSPMSGAVLQLSRGHQEVKLVDVKNPLAKITSE